MLEEIIAYYEKYLLNFVELDKPKMPNFDVFAYTENEYLTLINEENGIYDLVDDEWVTLNYLTYN